MKALLINPAYRDGILRKAVITPPLALLNIASHFPEGWDIRLVDENRQAATGRESADLVAISTLTPNSPRAYYLSEMYRSRGIPVVIGGIHPTMMPDEAAGHADSILIGEAESAIGNLVEDATHGKLRKTYAGVRSDISHMRMPRHDLANGKYMMSAVQTSRGCPNSCEFCSVTIFNGATYRRRSIESINRELTQLKSKRVFFVDDNIVGINKSHREDAMRLFKSLKDHNIEWVSQASINAASDPELLGMMSDSGCIGLLVGIESINEDVLRRMNKNTNLNMGVENYKKSLRAFHNHGISINGSFVIGNDSDSKSVFRKLPDFICDAEFDRSQVTISTPMPGTGLYKRLSRDNRIFQNDYPRDWKMYDCANVVFKPKKMTAAELQDGFGEIYDRITSPVTSAVRFLNSIANTSRLTTSVSSLYYNLMVNQAVRLHQKRLEGLTPALHA